MKTLLKMLVCAAVSASTLLSCNNADGGQEKDAAQKNVVELLKALEQNNDEPATITEDYKDVICNGLMSLKKDSLYFIEDGDKVYSLTITDSIIVLLWASGSLNETCEYAGYAKAIYEESLKNEPPPEEIDRPVGSCPKLTLSKDTLFFGKQGGVDSSTVAEDYGFKFDGCGSERKDSEWKWEEQEWAEWEKIKNYTRSEYRVWGDNGIDTVKNDYCRDNYCDEIGFRIHTYQSYKQIFDDVPIMKAECSWLSLTKTNAYSLRVSVSENETLKERERTIFLTVIPNCGAELTIIQSAE